ncbi:RING-H2 finger protein ATL16-like [Canna indica]|uniref:RING-type E3 ubiquitin transferase n=1 Tax=Canna indica TaxID=4628 RepID=A0AAQ3KQQ9_9LILI|nr:RING-H2 finger protein ATL16-like [Canna indica]
MLSASNSVPSLMDTGNHHPSMKPQLSPPVSSSSFPILAISIIGILLTFMLLLSYYVFVIKCCLNWQPSNIISWLSQFRRQRRWREQSLVLYSTSASSRGLDEPTIQAIPTFLYQKRSESIIRGCSHECSVCLNELEEEEKIRLLPNCFHVFHIDCIDTWLQKNDNCPVCRSSIATSTQIPAAYLMALAPLHEPFKKTDVLIKIKDEESDLTERSTTSNSCFSSPRKSEQRFGHKKLQHLISKGDECIDVRENHGGNFCVQLMRRSFSMDSSRDKQLYMTIQKILHQTPHLQDVSGESSSSSGRIRRSIFPFGWSSRVAVLPVQVEI